jgi:hypothetical protein
MSRTTAMIGIRPEELRWIRLLLALLRHPDPGMHELARQALLYLSQSADRPAASLPDARPLAF